MQTTDQIPQPVAFYSRKLVKREQSYSTIEIELLAIMAGLHAFQVYVGTGPVTVYCDHNPLVWLKSARLTNSRLLRWALCLSEMHLQIRHIKGTDNVIADWLSRNPAEHFE